MSVKISHLIDWRPMTTFSEWQSPIHRPPQFNTPLPNRNTMGLSLGFDKLLLHGAMLGNMPETKLEKKLIYSFVLCRILNR